MKAKLIATLCALLLAWGVSSPVAAQTPVPSVPASGDGQVLRITLDEAVQMVLDHNPALAADRLNPQIGDLRIAQAASAFTPSFTTAGGRVGQLSPPSSFLVGAQGTRTDTYTTSLGMSQRLPWFGSVYNVGWDNTRSRSDSFLQNFNPTLRSGFVFSFAQPLLRDFTIDNARQQLTTTERDRIISGARFKESTVHTVADAKRAYWNLVAARALVEVQQRSLDLSRELVRVNQARVDVGEAPPIDLLSAQAEVARREENLIIAQSASKQLEDVLRTLVIAPDRSDLWNVRIEPSDPPPAVQPLPDVDTAVQIALLTRADLLTARTEVENAVTSVKYYSNQVLPDVRLLANYQTTGLGGTKLDRVGTFPGILVPSGQRVDYNNVLDQALKADFPTWTVGFAINYPIGRSYDEASLARARLEQTQSRDRLKNSEINAVRQVRQAAWQVEMNSKRIETARLARELAEQREDAEQKRFEVGMSTSFLVIQAQRDLAEARNNELGARLAYATSLIDFESIQQAGPAQSGSGGNGSVQPLPPPRLSTVLTTSTAAAGSNTPQ